MGILYIFRDETFENEEDMKDFISELGIVFADEFTRVDEGIEVFFDLNKEEVGGKLKESIEEAERGGFVAEGLNIVVTFGVVGGGEDFFVHFKEEVAFPENISEDFIKEKVDENGQGFKDIYFNLVDKLGEADQKSYI